MSQAQLCDGERQCSDKSDETGCFHVISRSVQKPSPPPGLITFAPAHKTTTGGARGYVITQVEDDVSGAVQCPETQFQCPGDVSGGGGGGGGGGL